MTSEQLAELSDEQLAGLIAGTPVDPASSLVAADGRPARAHVSKNCPSCQASPKFRTDASPFGKTRTIVCKKCGHTIEVTTEA